MIPRCSVRLPRAGNRLAVPALLAPGSSPSFDADTARRLRQGTGHRWSAALDRGEGVAFVPGRLMRDHGRGGRPTRHDADLYKNGTPSSV